MNREIAPLLLRLFLAFVLIYGTLDNVVSHERMIEFRDFLAKNGFPMPMFSAHLSAYGQFIAGILLALGLFTRLTSIVVIINFIAALAMVHVGLPFNANIAPLRTTKASQKPRLLSPASNKGRTAPPSVMMIATGTPT